MLNIKRISLILAATLLLLTGCGSSKDGTSSGQASFLDTQAAEHSQAVALYKQRCLNCHASDLQGRAGPGLRTVGDQLDEQQIFEIIYDGRSKQGMPAFHNILKEAEITLLAEWLATLKQ